MIVCTKEEPVKFAYSDRYQPRQEDHPRHMHGEYEILLFMEGGPAYVVDGREFPLSAGTLLLVPPNAYHFALIKDARRYCRYLIDFRGDAVDPALLNCFPEQGYSCQLPEGHPILHCFQRLQSLLRTGLEAQRNLILQTFCTQILLELMGMGQAGEEEHSDPVLSYIDRNLNQIHCAQDIADALYISSSTLSHQFRERMGISLMKYIRQKRLLLARQLLEQGKKPLEVCTQCGFGEYTTFYKAYLRYYGVAPSQSN